MFVTETSQMMRPPVGRPRPLARGLVAPAAVKSSSSATRTARNPQPRGRRPSDVTSVSSDPPLSARSGGRPRPGEAMRTTPVPKPVLTERREREGSCERNSESRASTRPSTEVSGAVVKDEYAIDDHGSDLDTPVELVQDVPRRETAPVEYNLQPSWTADPLAQGTDLEN